nr:ORF1 [Torque teno arctocephalus australis virus]
MAYRYRGRRHRRWRRGRIWRNRRKRYHYWARRRFWRRRLHHRRGTIQVRRTKCKRYKYIVFRGWEPLGNLCSNSTAGEEAQPWKDIEYQHAPGANANWSGTWGHHYFTFATLLQRSNCRYNWCSGDWTSYDYMEFCYAIIYLPVMTEVDWMFGIDGTLSKEEDPQSSYVQKEATWFHPGWMINQPGTHIVMSARSRPNWRRWYRIIVKAPATWESVYPLWRAKDFIIFWWWWSWVDLNHGLFDYVRTVECSGGEHGDFCRNRRPWWHERQHVENCDQWVDRSTYQPTDSNLCNDDGTNKKMRSWGPFLPSNFTNTLETHGVSLWFKYKVKFRVSGDANWREKQPLATDFNATVPRAPGAPDPPHPGEIQPGTKKKRPKDPWDIHAGDLDQHGILTERSYERITETRPGTLQMPMEKPRKRVRFRRHDILNDHRRKRIRMLINQLIG